MNTLSWHNVSFLKHLLKSKIWDVEGGPVTFQTEDWSNFIAFTIFLQQFFQWVHMNYGWVTDGPFRIGLSLNTIPKVKQS